MKGWGLVVLSHGLWQRRFGGNPQVIGQTLRVNSQPHTIIGVAPPYFKVPPRAELWGPIQFGEQHRRARGRYLAVIRRLKPGVSARRAMRVDPLVALRYE